MVRLIRRYWTDQVWSKVFAGAILTILGSLIYYLWKKTYGDINFWDAFFDFLKLKASIWIYLVSFIPIALVYSKLWPTKKVYSKPHIKTWGIQITYPSDNGIVVREEIVKGKFDRLPKHATIRIFVVNNTQTKCWISSHPMEVDKGSKTWRCRVYIGADGEVNRTFFLVAAVDLGESNYWIEHYREASRSANKWHPFNYPLPNELTECHKIKVVRKA